MFVKKNKKGFSLIEMLVVIAVLALLVSIIVPTVGRANVKAAAATNAANLRSVEAQIAVLKTSNPNGFKHLLENADQTVLDIVNALHLPNLGPLTSSVNSVKNKLTSIIGTKLEDPTSSYARLAEYNAYNSIATNGVLILPFKTPITIDNVPTSEAVNAGIMNIPADLQMTVYITDYTIIATYEYNGSRFTKDDFAVVAETGDGSAIGSGGDSGDKIRDDFGDEVEGDVSNALKCTTYGHDYKGSNNICSRCGIAKPDCSEKCTCTDYVAKSWFDKSCKNCGCPEHS
mgnify:CR=1 FL=1